jgi:hypothetical protein
MSAMRLPDPDDASCYSCDQRRMCFMFKFFREHFHRKMRDPDENLSRFHELVARCCEEYKHE